jgi:tetratricopeptide (TPR) repeat protein
MKGIKPLSRACCLLFLLSLWATALRAQDPGLANQYFSDGEYEKAATLFEQLLEKDERNDYYFNRFVDCLINLEEYDRCEKSIKKQIKRNAENAALYVTYGTLLERMNKEQDAKAQYAKAIEKMAPDFAAVSRLANTFTQATKYEYAIQAYERGGEMLNMKNRFAFNLGEVYRRKGDTEKMVDSYLDAVEDDPSKVSLIETQFARYLSAEDFTGLQERLYTRIQAKENPDFIEILAWSFVQRKDYKSALRQFKALDLRLSEQGNRVFKLAEDAAENKDYDTAISGFEYIIQEKGPNNPLFYDAKQYVMECRRKKITEGYDFTTQDLTVLEAEFEAFLSQHGRNRQTVEIVRQLADLEAYYMNNLPKAISILEEMTKMPGLDRERMARLKINLGDYYLISGDVWESTLLYSQVDKDFREEPLGQEARFKNARLSYFKGDFEWAQAQFDVLKAATTKMISNDALDLSVFIMDNLNLDTTSEAISLYSSAEMLVFQNRFPEAFLKLDTLRNRFPEHLLQDDILYLEAQIHLKKRAYEKAAKLFEEIFTKYPEDIRADNAMFALADLYEHQLNNAKEAQNLYEKVFMDYSGSVFAVDARKRFRILRGDKMQ